MVGAGPRTLPALLLVWTAVGCAGAARRPEPPPPPAPVSLSRLLPSVLLPRSVLVLEGRNLVDAAAHVLRLSGRSGRGEVELELPVRPTGVERAEVRTDDSVFEALGEGRFEGTALVVSRSASGETCGAPLLVTLQLVRHLSPRLAAVGEGLVHLNSGVQLEGDGLLLGGPEGQTLAELKGCFLPAGASLPCRQVQVRMLVRPAADGDRRHGAFEFSPVIAGARPGSLVGTVGLVNLHPDGHRDAGAPLGASFQLEPTRLERLQPAAVSLGQYLEIQGAGFVGAPGSTVIRFAGTWTARGGAAEPASFELVPAYLAGTAARYVLEEGQGPGRRLELRLARGTLVGTWTPVVVWGSEQVEGEGASLELQLLPARQVVWVRFAESWSQALRLYGLRAADPLVRRRVLEVMRRDYAGVNVEFREDEPQDFELYAKLDLVGPDPNGLDLLGYDNTPGKDVGNQRLYDWLGGVNALTQQDGYPGYGGVFLESVLGFSLHPPAPVQKSALASPRFDEIFDPFRPDRGAALTSAEAAAAPELGDTAACPAADRPTRIGCAVRVLGNLVGSIATHELGHSLGLARPFGAATEFHDPGDRPNRLMDAGEARPFAERAELDGQGPAVFCDEEYAYLTRILPLDPPGDPGRTRPVCN